MKIYTKNNKTVIDFEGASLISMKKIDNAIYINNDVDVINLDTVIGDFNTGIFYDSKQNINPSLVVKEIILSKKTNNTIHYLIKKHMKKSFLRWFILKVIKFQH